MNFPLLEVGRIGEQTALLLALPIGMLFGWSLERGGLGNARKLAGQFYLTDLTVFKVMFSAIVTAALGVFWLTRIGWLDLSLVAIPPTYIVPQLLGGLVFGAGFAVCGLCPGTSCVAAATGRADGLAVIGGLLAGVLAFGEVQPGIQQFYDSSPRGALTLYHALGVSRPVTIALVVAVALLGFGLAEWIEQRKARA
jgi:hypothetical protein